MRPDHADVGGVVVISGAAAALGYGAFGGATPGRLAFVKAFGPDAILKMLAGR